MAEKLAKFPVMELFGPTIQGEGLLTGTVSHFLRFGGCGLRCTWCDSMYAVLPEEIKRYRTIMTSHEILEAVAALPRAPYITLTGGDPCIHKQMGDILPALNSLEMWVAIETQGQLFPDWLVQVDVVTFSPKPPSSGNVVDIEDMRRWLQARSRSPWPGRTCIKVVVATNEDMEYALDVYRRIPSHYYEAFYFTAQTPLTFLDTDAGATYASPEMKLQGVLEQQRRLAGEILTRACQGTNFNSKVHIGCQGHVLLWPEHDKGV